MSILCKNRAINDLSNEKDQNGSNRSSFCLLFFSLCADVHIYRYSASTFICRYAPIPIQPLELHFWITRVSGFNQIKSFIWTAEEVILALLKGHECFSPFFIAFSHPIIVVLLTQEPFFSTHTRLAEASLLSKNKQYCSRHPSHPTPQV